MVKHASLIHRVLTVILHLLASTDYHFTTREEMQKGIDNGDFIENAVFSGNMYGTR